MDQKQRLFIYDRKEMIVLVLLSVMVALFAFTLGVHLGKNLGHPELVGTTGTTAPAATVPDAVPNRQDLTEQAAGAPDVVDETLSRTLHDEVAQTGIKLDHPRPVALPETQKRAAAKRAPLTLASIEAAGRPSPEGRYTLQVGSHQKLSDAKDQVDALEALGLRPYLRAVDLEGKGRWYRVYLGGFVSHDDAESAGAHFRAKKMIDSFVVANRVK